MRRAFATLSFPFRTVSIKICQPIAYTEKVWQDILMLVVDEKRVHLLLEDRADYALRKFHGNVWEIAEKH